MPVYLFSFVFIGECDQHVDIVVIQAVREELEGVTELSVGQAATVVLIDRLEHGLEGALQSVDETG